MSVRFLCQINNLILCGVSIKFFICSSYTFYVNINIWHIRPSVKTFFISCPNRKVPQTIAGISCNNLFAGIPVIVSALAFSKRNLNDLRLFCQECIYNANISSVVSRQQTNRIVVTVRTVNFKVQIFVFFKIHFWNRKPLPAVNCSYFMPLRLWCFINKLILSRII